MTAPLDDRAMLWSRPVIIAWGSLQLKHADVIYPGGEVFERGSEEHRARNRRMVEQGEFGDLYRDPTNTIREGFTNKRWLPPRPGTAHTRVWRIK